MKQSIRENLGIIVQYKVKIRLLIAGALGGELAAELPFTLTHPKPADTPQPQESKSKTIGSSHTNQEGTANGAQESNSDPTADFDLIQFDRYFVFF